MDVHASPDELPELQAFLGAFQVRFRRPEGRAALERYTTGLLTELPNKNCDTIAQAVPGTSAQRLQEFLTNMQWDEADLNRQRVQKMIAEATLGDGVLVLDDTGFPKQGHAGQGGQLSDRGHLLLHGSAGHLAGSGAVVPAQRLGQGCRPAVPGSCPGRGGVSDQARDRIGAPRSGPCLGCASSVCRGRCRLWGQPELLGGLGGPTRAVCGRGADGLRGKCRARGDHPGVAGG
jgi:hypothetical protein